MRTSARRGLIATIDDVRRAGVVAAIPRVFRHGGGLQGVIASSARRFGDRVAVVDEHGPLTYRELDALVREASPLFRRGERVGIECRDGRWLLAAAAGAMRAGADAVLLGPALGELDRAAVLRREGISAVVVEGRGGLEVGRGGFDTRPAVATQPAAGAAGRGRLVLLTSGTTGEPTAPRRAALNPLTVSSLIAAIGLREGERVLVLPPLHHGHGLSLTVACLMLGAPVIVGSTLGVEEQVAAAATAGVISGVPTQLGRLVGHASAASVRPRRIVSGSGRLSPALAARMQDLYGPVLVDFFGTTQTGTVTIATADDLASAPGTVGRPAAGVRISVRDGLVYAGRRATGDRGHLDDAGRLFLTGRADDLVVSGGENISISNVEDYLLGHAAVADAHVSAVADEEFGTRLVARVVLTRGFDVAAVRADVCRDLGRAKLPRFEIVAAIDRTPTGKVRLPRTPTVSAAPDAPSTG